MCKHLATIVSTDNGWTACAVGGHLLAGFGNPGYRKMLGYLKLNRIAYLSIDDYIAWAKNVHNVIRKTGCYYDGNKLNNTDRV